MICGLGSNVLGTLATDNKGHIVWAKNPITPKKRKDQKKERACAQLSLLISRASPSVAQALSHSGSDLSLSSIVRSNQGRSHQPKFLIL